MDRPPAAAAEYGNLREQNIEMAKRECRRYAAPLENPGLNYPA